jgi:hypothetical protein
MAAVELMDTRREKMLTDQWIDHLNTNRVMLAKPHNWAYKNEPNAQCDRWRDHMKSELRRLVGDVYDMDGIYTFNEMCYIQLIAGRRRTEEIGTFTGSWYI